MAVDFSTNERRNMNIEDLTPEQREKVAACKTPEDVLAVAKAEGIELTDEQLQDVAGGKSWEEIIYHGY